MLFGVTLVVNAYIPHNDIISQKSHNGMRAEQLFYCCLGFGQRILDNNNDV